MADHGKASGFITRSKDPLTGGPPLDRLLEPITPVEDFFIRNHATVDPVVELDAWRLTIRALDGTDVALAHHELQTLERVDIEVTVQCAGNRRSGLVQVRDVPGEVPWGDEAVSTALWSGWRLRDVLALGGIEQHDEVTHIEFVGADTITKAHGEINFGGSIPAAKAFADEVLVADTMNGGPLPRVHGFPARVIVPGFVGARSVKWLDSIVARDEISTNFYQRGYSLYPPEMTREDHDEAAGVMLGELPVNSVICVPAAAATLDAGVVRIAGWASPGGDRHIARVEISIDGGCSWVDARLRDAPRPFVWSMWEIEAELPAGSLELVVRATDSAGTTQPEDPTPLWNFKGYMNNAWCRIPVMVK